MNPTVSKPLLRAALKRVIDDERGGKGRGPNWPHTLGALAACVALKPGIALAQDSATEPNTLPRIQVEADAAELEPATQITRTRQSLNEVPQSLAVIDRSVLEAQGATTLSDALRNVPGITLSAGEGGVIGDNINLRGFSARTDLFVDGMRDRAQYSRDTFFLDSIEVLKGPSSMLFGRGSTGGVINQVSKQPRGEKFSEVGATLGTDATYRTTFDISGPLSDSTAFRIAAFGHSSESTRDIVESERLGIAPSLRLELGAATEFVLSSMHQRREDIPDYGFPFVEGGTEENPARPVRAKRNRFFGFTDDSFEQDVDIASARISHEFSPMLSLRNHTQFSSARIHAEPTRINNAGARDRLERHIDDRALFNQTDLVTHFGSDGLRHTLIAGVEVGQDRYENQSYSITGEPPQSLTDPVYGPMPDSIIRSKNTLTDNEGTTVAAYLNEQLDVGEHWKLIAGVRRDRFEFESTITNSAGMVTTDASKTDQMTSVRAGAVYQPDGIQTYYASYGTSFNPSAETLTLSAANQDIDPEKNRSLEIGGKWTFAENTLLLTSAVFRVEKMNARTNDPLVGITLDGKTRVQGFEIGLSGSLGAQWHALLGYTYLDGEIRRLTDGGTNGGVRDGNVLPNTPRHTASLWTTYDLPHQWQIGGGVVYSSDRLLNNANTALVDGYTRLDATVAYLADRYTIRVYFHNLSDEEYFEVASAGRATPAAGRSGLATLTWRF